MSAATLLDRGSRRRGEHDTWRRLGRRRARWVGVAALGVAVLIGLAGSPPGRALLGAPDPNERVLAGEDDAVVVSFLAPGWWPLFSREPFFEPLPAMHLTTPPLVTAGSTVLLDPGQPLDPAQVVVSEQYVDRASGHAAVPRGLRVGDQVNVVFQLRNLGAETLRSVRLMDPVFGRVDIDAPVEPYGSARVTLRDVTVPPRLEAAALPRLALGTDMRGRDLAARLAAGTWRLIQIAGAAAVLALLLGGGAGWVAARRGRPVVRVLGRARLVLVTFPFLLVTLVIVLLTGATAPVLTLLTAAVSVPVTGRRVRDAVVTLERGVRVETAIASGWTRRDVDRRIVLPAVIGVAASTALAVAAAAALVETSLGFVGLEPAAPNVSLGTMIADVSPVIETSAGYLLLPGLLIALVTTACLLLSEALGQVYDPAVDAS